MGCKNAYAPDSGGSGNSGGPSSLLVAANFDDNTLDGMAFSGTASGELSSSVHYSKPNSLHVYGRTGNNNGIAILLASILPRGATVTFSARVYPVQSASARINLNLNTNSSAVTVVGPVQVQANQWTLVEGDYNVPADAIWIRANIALNNNTCDFYVDDIKISLKSGTLPDSSIQQNLAPLKSAPRFAERNLYIGAVVNPIVLFDPSGNRQKLLVKHYNSFAPQDELKPISVLEYKGSVDGLPATNDHAKLNFNMAIPAYEFAKKNNMIMMAHHMVWHTQCPDWFFYENYDTNKTLAGRDLMLKRMENYIKDELEWNQTHYPGLVKMWSVVNEAFTGNSPVSMNPSLWQQTIGDDYIAKAFQYANQYRTDPEIKLIYNEVNMEKYQSRIDYCMNYIKQYNVQLDGIGFQFHIDMDSPSAATIKSNLERVGKDYEVYITELDIAGVDISAMPALQQRYNEVIGAILDANVNLKCIRSHGLTDNQSWLINKYNQDEYPLLWDANNQAKPAYYGVMQAAGANINQ